MITTEQQPTQTAEEFWAAVDAEFDRLDSLVCDICEQPILADERYSASDDGIAEHTACTQHWLRHNFGREGLS